MKKLVIASDAFLPRYCGVARFLESIIPLLQKKFDVSVLAPDFGEDSIPVKKTKFRTLKFGVNDFKPPIIGRPQKRIIDEAVRNADVVFVQDIGPIGSYTLKAAKKFGTPSVYFMHVIDSVLFSQVIPMPQFLRKIVKRIVPFFVKPIYERAGHIVIAGNESREYLDSMKAAVPKTQIRLGIDTRRFSPPADKSKAKKKMGLDPNSFVVGYVGRVATEKGIATLVEAFGSFRKRHPDAKTLLVGKATSEFSGLTKREGIIMPGPQSDVAPWYRAMDVFVLPSHHEVACLVTKEAMSSGVPIVTTPIGDLRDYVMEWKNGVFFEPRNAEELLAHLEKLYKETRLRKGLGEKARKTIVRDYDWITNAGKIVEVIERAAKKASVA